MEHPMTKITVFTSLTLDGVMQAPGRPDEDRRDGFEHGGWAAPYADAMIAGLAGEDAATNGGILLGRRTYEDFYSFWPKQGDNPFTKILDETQKFVASNSLREPLPWQNSTLLSGDAADGVARLREQPGKDLVVLGSGNLAQSLMRRDLVDRYILLIHPLVLGTGRRLFEGDLPRVALHLVDSRTSTTGVVVARYDPDRSSGS